MIIGIETTNSGIPAILTVSETNVILLVVGILNIGWNIEV